MAVKIESSCERQNCERGIGEYATSEISRLALANRGKDVPSEGGGGRHYIHRVSASSSGPVDTGFRKLVCSLLHSSLEALQSKVVRMVLPTSVFAP